MGLVGILFLVLVPLVVNELDRSLPRLGMWLARRAEAFLPPDQRAFYGWIAEAEAAMDLVAAGQRTRLWFVAQQAFLLVAVAPRLRLKHTLRNRQPAVPADRRRARRWPLPASLLALGAFAVAAPMVAAEPAGSATAGSADGGLLGLAGFLAGLLALVTGGVAGRHLARRHRR